MVKVEEVIKDMHEWSWQTMSMEICFFVLLRARHINTMTAKLLWLKWSSSLVCHHPYCLSFFTVKGQNNGISKTSCKLDEADFLKGLNFLIPSRNDSLVRLRGFC